MRGEAEIEADVAAIRQQWQAGELGDEELATQLRALAAERAALKEQQQPQPPFPSAEDLGASDLAALLSPRLLAAFAAALEAGRRVYVAWPDVMKAATDGR